jgi:hypothetical protein
MASKLPIVSGTSVETTAATAVVMILDAALLLLA